MRILFALLLLLLVVFLGLNRNRIYLRDPLARVTRNGAVSEKFAVLINYSNDVLLEDTSVAGQHRLYLLQHWNQALSTPTAPLRCLGTLACLLDADHATAEVLRGRSMANPVQMSDRRLSFTAADGAAAVISLR